MKQHIWKYWLVGTSALSIWWATGIHIDHYLKGYISNEILLNLPVESLAIFATFFGARMWLKTTRERLPWYLFMLAQVFFYLSGVMYTNYHTWFGVPATIKSWAAVPDIIFYPLMFAGLYLLDRNHNPDRDVWQILDGVMLGIVLVLLAVFLTPARGRSPSL